MNRKQHLGHHVKALLVTGCAYARTTADRSVEVGDGAALQVHSQSETRSAGRGHAGRQNVSATCMFPRKGSRHGDSIPFWMLSGLSPPPWSLQSPHSVLLVTRPHAGPLIQPLTVKWLHPHPSVMHTAQAVHHRLLTERPKDHWLDQGTPCDGTVQPSGRPEGEGPAGHGPQAPPAPPPSSPAQTPLYLSPDTWLQKEHTAKL